MMKLIRRSAAVVVGLALAAVCTIGTYSYELKRHADEVVRIAYELSQQGKPPTTQQLQQRFGTALRQPDPCIENGCGYELLLSNRILATLHLAPYTVLRAHFWATNGVVDENSLEFWTVPSQRAIVLSYVEVKYCDRCNFFRINPSSDSSPLCTTGSIEIGNASPASNKRIALTLDTGCLTAWRRCASAAELFPKVWQRTSARTIRCRLPNHDGVVDDASDQPQNP